ncbi:MAG: alpha/beta hydrolase [Telluria sp.]
MPAKPRRPFLKWMLRLYVMLGVAVLVAIPVGYQATGFDDRILRSEGAVAVIRDGGQLNFVPQDRTPSTALLFLPGAMVDPDAYAPMAHAVAAKGYRVTLLSLALRLAPTEASVAGLMQEIRHIMASDPSIRHWVVAGHSRGGKLAARFAYENPDSLGGLFLVATSHPDRQFDLSRLSLPVTKVVGTQDGVASPEAIAGNARFLPKHTAWVRIEGANHAQFGYYRFQLGDKAASIDRLQQQQLLVDAILRHLSSAAERP